MRTNDPVTLLGDQRLVLSLYYFADLRVADVAFVAVVGTAVAVSATTTGGREWPVVS